MRNAVSIQGRLPWMQKNDPTVLSTLIQNGNVNTAAAVLEHFASERGLKIVEVARFTQGNVDAAFARGVTK